MTHVSIRRALLVLAALLASASVPAQPTTPGSMDYSFGFQGIGFFDLGAPADFQAVATALQADGKLIVGGNAALSDSCGGIAFARFNTDGSLDRTYGENGWLKVVPQPYSCMSMPMQMQAMGASSGGYNVTFVGRFRGEFLLGSADVYGTGWVGWTTDAQLSPTFTARSMASATYGNYFIVAGYDNREPAGTPGRMSAFARVYGGGGAYVDMGFGTNGLLKYAMGTESDEAVGAVLDYDGSFTFAGTLRDAGSATGSDFYLGRMNADGTLNATWGSGGKRVVDFNGRDDVAVALVRNLNQQLLVVGSAGADSMGTAIRLPAIVKTLASSIDPSPSFGMGGKSTLFLPDGMDGDFLTAWDSGTQRAVAAGTVTNRATGARSSVLFGFLSEYGYPYGLGPDGTVYSAGALDPRGFMPADPYGETFFVAATGAASGIALSKYGNNGADPAYGMHSFDLIGETGTLDEGGSMAMLPDGGMVIAGQARRRSNSSTLGGVVRLSANGARDLSFGSGGGTAFLLPAPGMDQFFPRAIATYPDGRIVVGSTAMSPNGPTIVVARLMADGSRDITWNGGQDVTLAPIQGALMELMAMTVQPDGAVLLAGHASVNGTVPVALARLLPDGTPDNSFGAGGRAYLSGPGSSPNWRQMGNGLMLEPDGRFYVAASFFDGSGIARFAVLRVMPNGALDPTWGNGGAAYGPLPAGLSPDGAAFGLAKQPDGRIVASGDCSSLSCIVRFTPEGQPDATFGIGGLAQTEIGSMYNGFVGVAVQPDGKIVAGGDNGSFILARVRANGMPDTSFNWQGYVYSLGQAQARNFFMTAEGKLVIAGRSLANFELAAVRHNGGGDDSPDAFSFPSVNDVPTLTYQVSGAVPLTGFDVPATVTVFPGEVSLDGCQTWQGPSAIVSPGQSICVRHMSSQTPGDTLTTTVTIGDTTATFSSTTASIETTITSQPSSPTGPTVSFSFSSNAAAATFECRLDGGTFGPCASPFAIGGLPSGTHTFEVRAVSGASVDATPASATFTVDATAPETTITSGPDASTALATATFTFVSDDPTATFECLVDSAPFAACTSPMSLSGVAEGNHTFVVRAVDAAGNRDATPAVRTWTVDTRPPNTSIDEGQGPSGFVADSTATFTFRSDETASTFECRLDGAAFAACAGVVNYSGLAEGSHTFEVRAIDAAGNRDATPAARTWTVDTLPPDTTFVSAPSGTVASTSATLAFDSPNGGSFYQCSLDGAAFAGCPSPVNLTGLGQGTHTFRVYASDAAGNVDATPATATWIVDTVGPDTLITSAPMGTVASTSATIVFTSEPGAAFECRLDGSAFAACASPQSLSGLAQGPHTFEVRARDAVGNVDASPASATWSIDTIAPQTTITSGPSGTVVSATATIVFSADDPAATFQCQLDGGGYAACTSPVGLSGLADGAHAFDVRAVDAYGNVDASAASIAWTVDTTAADALITSAPAGAVASTAATIAFTSEAGATFECSLDAGAYGACTSPVTLAGLAQGSHTFRVRARDAWGNVDATPASATWIVDTVAPDTAITGGPSGNNQPATATFTFTSTEAGGTFECRLDGSAFVGCASGVTYTLAKGSHTFDVRAIDVAGNVDATPATRTWRSN